jgi:uncharacterized protein YndB with AHSA1/START domain
MVKWGFIAVGVVVGLVLAMAIAGALLPAGHVAAREAHFARTAADVFAAISDVARYGEWRTGLRSVRVVQHDPLRWVEDGPHGAVTFQLEEAAAPSRMVSRIADPDLPFGGRWIYELTPAGDGTTLRITEEGEVYNPVLRFLSRFVFSQTATIEGYLRDLERRLGR